MSFNHSYSCFRVSLCHYFLIFQIDEADEEDDDAPIGFPAGAVSETVSASTTCEPPQSITVAIESSSQHDDRVSLDAEDSLSDVSSGHVVGCTTLSLRPLIASPHESLKGTGEAPIFSRGNLSELIADIPLYVASHDSLSISVSIFFS